MAPLITGYHHKLSCHEISKNLPNLIQSFYVCLSNNPYMGNSKKKSVITRSRFAISWQRKQKDKLSTCLPELALEEVEVRGALEVTGASGACSEGFPLRVNELMAHLHRYHEFQVNRKVKMHFLIF